MTVGLNIKLSLKRSEFLLKAHTPSAIIEYGCETSFVKTSYLEKFVNKQYFNKLCKESCPNYGNKWTCPPYAPDYSQFVTKYEYIYILLLYIELEQLDYIKQDYLKVKAANWILKSRIDKALRASLNENEFYISAGSCRLCKSCKKKVGEPCIHPELRTYSFEALGINVSLLTTNLFQKDLLWYKPRELPKYTSVVAGLLTNDEIANTKVIDKLKELR